MVAGVLLLATRPPQDVMETVSLTAAAWLLVWVLVVSADAVHAARESAGRLSRLHPRGRSSWPTDHG
jgi:hypothetical protein